MSHMSSFSQVTLALAYSAFVVADAAITCPDDSFIGVCERLGIASGEVYGASENPVDTAALVAASAHAAAVARELQATPLTWSVTADKRRMARELHAVCLDLDGALDLLLSASGNRRLSLEAITRSAELVSLALTVAERHLALVGGTRPAVRS